MKKFFKFLNIIAFIAVTGFFFVACNSDIDNGPGNDGTKPDNDGTKPDNDGAKPIDGTGSSEYLGFSYTEEDGAITIIRYQGNGGNLTIPSEIDGKPVTCIGKTAFSNCTSLTGVIIPDNITSIGEWAFHDCTSLTSVTIGSGVTGIGDYAFNDCTGLAAINVDPDNTVFSSVDGILYNKNKTEFLIIPRALAGTVTIPNGITGIGRYDFDGRTGLTGVTIGSGVTDIETDAFLGCTGLTSITIGSGVTDIKNAFYGCTSLITINVDAANTAYSSQDGVLYNKDKTTLVMYPKGKTGDFTIPNSVTKIENEAFRYCTGLTDVTIGNNVTDMGEFAFEGCTGLSGITIGSGVTYIRRYAFYGCTGLTDVTIGNNVTGIGSYAFGDCTSLNNITIPTSVTFIQDRVFSGCTGLTAINVDSANTYYKSIDGVVYLITNGYGNAVNYIAIYPQGKTGDFIIPNGVTEIYFLAFAGCIYLTDVTIPASVTTIGSQAFWYSGLTGIIIPDTVTDIKGGAFSSCANLTKVWFKGTISSDKFDKDWNGDTTFDGDLRDKFYETDPENGTPKMYSTTAPVNKDSIWKDRVSIVPGTYVKSNGDHITFSNGGSATLVNSNGTGLYYGTWALTGFDTIYASVNGGMYFSIDDGSAVGNNGTWVRSQTQ